MHEGFEIGYEEKDDSGTSTPKDKLFSEDADYASVFKSRPRVAHSPVTSPVAGMDDVFEEDSYLDDSSFVDDHMIVGDSPSKATFRAK